MVFDNGIHINGIIGEDYTYSDFIKDLVEYKLQLHGNLNIYIDSNGGYVDEADKIYEKLKDLSKKYTIKTYNDGNVMSCATIIFSAGKERVFDFAKGNILIHNPWTTVEGDSSTLREIANELQTTEDRYTLIYAKLAKQDVSYVSKIMDENRPLTVSEVKKLKLATVVKNEDIAPVIENKEQMQTYAFVAIHKINNIEKNNKKMKIIESLKTLLKVHEVKNLVVTGADGVDYEVVNDDNTEDLKVGSKVLVDGQVYDGEIILADDTVITVENGVVTKIEQPEEEVDPETEATVEAEVEPQPEEKQPGENEYVEYLAGKLDELYGIVATLQEKVDALESEKAQVEEKYNKIKNLASTEKINTVTERKEEKRQSFFSFDK